jgi:outer membrane lipoprotein-sorting protein
MNHSIRITFKIATALVAPLAVALAIITAAPAAAAEVDEVVAKANHASYYQGVDGRAKVDMTITDSQGRERTRQFIILRKDGDDSLDSDQKFYVYFRRPADVNGTAFLVWKRAGADDDRWLYLPALDLVKRIAASDERTSFVGSHFYYEDVSGRNPDEDHHVLEEGTADYYVLKSTPKNPSQVEFGFYRTWIHRASFIPIRTEYYDADGKSYRTYEALEVQTIDGFTTVTSSRMSDTNVGGQTTIEYTAVKFNVGLPDDLFSERYLRNAPRKYLR